MTNIDIIESVITLLAIDGSLNKWEKQFFYDICQKLDISHGSRKAAIQKIQHGKGRVHLPEDTGDKHRLIYFLAQAIVADGKVVAKERKALDTIIDKLGIPKGYVDKFINARLQEVKAEHYSTATTSSSPLIACPKCHYEQPQSYQCKRCGIIFEKYQKMQGPSEEDQLWELLASSNTIRKRDD